MTALLCGAVMIASQAGGTSSTAGDSAAAVRSELVEAWADDFMATALRQAQVAGAIIAVVQGDRVVLTKGYGFADFERKAQVDAARTGFRIGSVAKVVTATAVMQLVEQGKLDLDRDVNEYLDFRIRSRDGSPTTLRHLLTHSAGFDQVIKALGYLDPKLVVPLPEVEGYLVANGPSQPFEILGTMPAGGATSTATDMARFMIAHLQDGRFDSVSILRPETARLMHSSAQSPPAPHGFAGMALGSSGGNWSGAS